MSKVEELKSLQPKINGKLYYNQNEIGNAVTDMATTNRNGITSENDFINMMNEKGWDVSKKGFPDFFCIKDGKFCLVEVKPRSSTSLRRNQIILMAYLASYGVPCFKWSPDGGFEQIAGILPKKKET